MADASPVEPRVTVADASAQLDRLSAGPHRRFNPLRDEWVLVSAERTRRPWLGQEEPPPVEVLPAYDPTCYLCPGNARANGERNPDYEATFAFTNDFAALQPGLPGGVMSDGLFRVEAESGTCRVICFSRRHDLTLARMSGSEVRRVIDLWADETTELAATYRWVQVFENRGKTMGASNPHPHGQIWAGTALPNEAAREDASQREHLRLKGRRLLLDYGAQESNGRRVVLEQDGWLAIVPFWAAWPYETLLLPTTPVRRLPELAPAERDRLASMLIRLLAGYDRLFKRPFPYSMGWHQAPFPEGDDEHWQLHAHFYPPLLRASVRKFMVGYELLAEPQRDITPELAAERLRAAVDEARAGA
ncbi:MAG: UDP-glucose--hexose-1-phosphate uridylyltransferase [Chloroflexota bacterium]